MNITEQLELLEQIKSDIKNAIEAKEVTVPSDTPFSSYADYIEAIQTGVGTLIEKSITSNGTYSASSDEADGYSSVTVNVPSITDTYILPIKLKDYVTGYILQSMSLRTPDTVNFDVVGSPTLSETPCTYTGFTTSNYLLSSDNFQPGNSSWEIGTKIKTGSSVTIDQFIFTSNLGSDRLALSISTDGHFHLLINNTGSWGWDVAVIDGITDLQTNTDYYIRCKFTTTAYTIEISPDKRTWITDGSEANTTPIYDAAIDISWGANRFNLYSYDVNYPFNGTIYGNECYFKINDVLQWQGCTLGQELTPQFDISKFIVTGSPTITADGIASGFTSSSYVSIPVQSVATTSYREEIEFTVPATIASTQVIKGTKTDNNGFRIMINTDKEIRLSLANTNSSNTWNVFSNTFLYQATASATYKVVLFWNGTKYTVSVYDENNNVLGTPVTANSNYPPKNAQIQIGNCAQWSYGRPFGGEINLKNYNVDVDGVSVFNGNQSGTDTYKVVGSGTTINYTAVGTPTITSNVVSDFSAADYVTSDVNFNPGSSSFEIGTKITMPSYNSPILNIPAGGGSFYWLEFDSSTSNLHFDFGGSNYGEIEDVSYPSEGQPLWIKLAYDGTDFVLSMSTDGTTYSNSVTVTANNFVAPNAPINFGVADLMTTFFYGSIDMSQTYFKVNGSVVWQGVTTVSDIQISYNLSKTGSKIATAIYRSAITDLYNKNGYSEYYTIDEVNKNYTLPAGEIYGMKFDKGAIMTTAPSVTANYGVTKVGTLTDNDGVISGFSSSAYLIANGLFSPGDKTWSLILDITTGVDVVTDQYLNSSNTVNSGPNEILIKNSKFAVALSSTGSSGDIGNTQSGTYTVLPNTKYLLRLSFSGTAYTLEYSIDNGTTWTTDITVTSSTKIYNNFVVILGTDYHSNSYINPFEGSININGCKCYLDDELFWQGTTPDNEYPTSEHPAVIVDEYINGSSYYYTYSNKLCIQGQRSNKPFPKNSTINLLKPLKDGNYFLNANKTWSKTKTGFILDNTGGDTYAWEAVGYIE